jgi:hypothetical protein
MQLVMPFNGKIMTFKHCGKESFERGGGITPKGIYKQRLQFMCKKLLGGVMQKVFLPCTILFGN